MTTPSSKPQILARFKMDDDGKPRFIQDAGKRHYRLVFEIEDAPPDVYAATFELDPTYYDSRRIVRPDKDGKLRLETTSYGDYPLRVTLRTKKGETQVIETVTNALEAARSSMSENSAIDDAISDLAEH